MVAAVSLLSWWLLPFAVVLVVAVAAAAAPFREEGRRMAAANMHSHLSLAFLFRILPERFLLVFVALLENGVYTAARIDLNAHTSLSQTQVASDTAESGIWALLASPCCVGLFFCLSSLWSCLWLAFVAHLVIERNENPKVRWRGACLFQTSLQLSLCLDWRPFFSGVCKYLCACLTNRLRL